MKAIRPRSLKGIQYFANGYMGYNPSWWFVSIILFLYLLFPLFRKMMKSKVGTLILAILGFLFATVYTNINYKGFFINLIYVAPFIIGMFFSKYQLFDIVCGYMKKRWILATVILITFILCVLRVQVVNNKGLRYDYILAPLLCSIVYYFTGKSQDSKIYRLLEILGIHSFNIYLIHLFITNMYTTPYIYNLNSPIFMIGVTIAVSMLFSVLVEKIKKMGGITQ